MYKCRLLPVVLFVFACLIAPFSFSEEPPSSSTTSPPLPLPKDKFITAVNSMNGTTQSGLDAALDTLLGTSSPATAPPPSAAPPGTASQTPSETQITTPPESDSSTTTSTSTTGASGLNFLGN